MHRLEFSGQAELASMLLSQHTHFTTLLFFFSLPYVYISIYSTYTGISSFFFFFNEGRNAVTVQ